MSHRIAVIPGDGIGPEVVAVGEQVLAALAETRGRSFALERFELGADRYLRDGVTFPDEVARTIREECDAVLLGALGDPRVPGMQHARDILFGLRFGLDLYCNVRPVACLHDRLMPLEGRTAADCDFVVFRENTEGIYAGIGGQLKRGTPDEVAISESIHTRKGVERIIRAAFEHAVRTGKGSVHMADKHNAMPHAHELWIRVFREVAGEYPDIRAVHMFFDALCLHVLQDPSQFEVIVTENLFGDVLTDMAAVLQGGLGMAASANLHPGRVSMFEPVHGSAPDLAGKDQANPLATVLTVGLLARHLGYPEDEALLTAIVRDALEQRRCTRDVGGELGTRATGDWVVAEVRARG